MVTTTFRDMQVLLRLLEVRTRASDPAAEVREREKKAFTEATGKIWDDCDKLMPVAVEGVPGFVVSKSKQWLDLMKDAVKELEEWDPEDDVIEDDLRGGQQSTDESANRGGGDATNDRAAISAGVKEQALKVLNRIPQSIHVVIKQRLEKFVVDQSIVASHMMLLDMLLGRIRSISELIDESAEGLYLGDPELCLKKAGEARGTTIGVVQAVLLPFPPISSNAKEDKYVERALEWIVQVKPGTYSGERP